MPLILLLVLSAFLVFGLQKPSGPYQGEFSQDYGQLTVESQWTNQGCDVVASFQTKFGDHASLMAKMSKSFQHNEMRELNLWILELNTAYAQENILGLIQKNEIPTTTPPKEALPSEEPNHEVFTIGVTTAIIERDA